MFYKILPKWWAKRYQYGRKLYSLISMKILPTSFSPRTRHLYVFLSTPIVKTAIHTSTYINTMDEQVCLVTIKCDMHHGLPLLLSESGGRTTTCIVMTLSESSPTGSLDSASVLLFSSIFPALISFTSFTVLGPFSLSIK